MNYCLRVMFEDSPHMNADAHIEAENNLLNDKRSID